MSFSEGPWGMRPVPLDEDTAERLLRGLDRADAPPGYAPVSKVLRALNAPPDAAERAGEAEAVARFVALRRLGTTRRDGVPSTAWRPSAGRGGAPARHGPVRVGAASGGPGGPGGPRRPTGPGGLRRRAGGEARRRGRGALIGGTVVAVTAALVIAVATGTLPNGPQQVAHNALGAFGVSVPAGGDATTSHQVASPTGTSVEGTHGGGSRSAGGSVVGGDGSTRSGSGSGGATATTGSSKPPRSTTATTGPSSTTVPGGDGSAPAPGGGTVGGGGGGGPVPSTEVSIAGAMEGDLRVSPGTLLAVGYDLSMPGHHPGATVSVLQAVVQFDATCVSGRGGGFFTVAMSDESYHIPGSSTSWYPSDQSNDPATFQASGAVPDLCKGGLVSLRLGGVFQAGIGSTDTTDTASVRWHYATDGDGGWSNAVSVVPGS